MSEASERRRYPRYQIRLRGLVGPAGGLQSTCVICDYCTGGMLIQLPTDAPRQVSGAFRVGGEAKLNTEFLTPSGPQPFRISARVAWVGGDNVGLAFVAPSEHIVSALQLHDRIARAETGATQAREAGGEARCLARIRHSANGWFPTLVSELLTGTAKELVTTASQLASNVAQQKVFEDIATLERADQVETFIRSLNGVASGDSGQAALPDVGQMEDGELSLVDTDDFERWLQASRLAKTLEDRFGDVLGSIASRIGAVRGDPAATPAAVPFEPRQLALALKDFAQYADLCDDSRQVLFGHAAELLTRQLGVFYARIDDLLEEMGAPAQRRRYTVELRGPAPEDQREGSVEPPSHQAGQAAEASDAPSAAGMRSPFQAVAPGLEPAQLARLLANEARRREGLARQMMGAVREIPGLNDSTSEWLQQLDTLLTRSAVADPMFFQDAQHPLRDIIDQLWHLQMFRPSPDAAPDQDPLRNRVNELIGEIADGKPDSASLREVAARLDQEVDEQSKAYLRNVERVAQTSEGRDRVRRARYAVVQEINRRYAGCQVPDVLPELLQVGWQSLLELSWLRAESDRSHHWHLFELLDNLVALLGGEAAQPRPTEDDPRRLLQQVQDELASIAFDPFRRKQVENRLRRLLLFPDHGDRALITMPRLPQDDDTSASPAAPEGVSQRAWQQALERCTELSVGDRLRLLDGESGHRDTRIAWARTDGGLFTLVDHRGLRVRDIDLAELALGVHQKRIDLLADDGRAASERAVDAMLERMEQALSYHTAHDSLTGLINRQQFHAALERVLSELPDDAATGAVLWVDIDQFRLINDIHGYDVGDRLLVAIARQLEAIAGPGLVGHLGADRFAILRNDIGTTDAEQQAAGLCEAVQQLQVTESGQNIGVTTSVAVVGLNDVAGGFGRLMQAADNALAAAKAGGGNRAYLYREDDPDIARRNEQVHWVAQVDEALDHGHLRLRCQPIVPVRPGGGLVPHYEVLLGVASGSSDPLPVAEFIAAAERYNRMRAVDRWVAGTVIDWIAAHRQLMPALHGFAVNLSGQTASDPSFVDFVRQRFDQTGIDPSWVSFEVTETAAVGDFLRTTGIIQALKAMGCKVALDDFGSGLASYSYLKELPVDWLKIDGVFVRKIASDREDYAVVKSINEIGHFLGKKTIAEYVVDDETLNLVREIGVDFAQGFGISPPLLMDDLAQTVHIADGTTGAEALR